ncbi:hypothetical protein CGRA01v4_05916 [Colletotrichum graminicola]|nr:hypothetical protein CGRA01v4_05916 [Colletotrichum graminicola]
MHHTADYGAIRQWPYRENGAEVVEGLVEDLAKELKDSNLTDYKYFHLPRSEDVSMGQFVRSSKFIMLSLSHLKR